MKASRCVLGAVLFSGLCLLEGCGAGQYQIPNVEPVVKQKQGQDDDLLKDIEGEGSSDKKKDASHSSPDKK